MKIKNWKALIICLIIPLAVGGLSALITNNSMENYNSLIKPPISPPAILFPIVWTILYVLMGISSYRIYISNSPKAKNALFVYGLQLFFNFFWSIIFFNFSQYLFALIWLLIMIVLIAVMIAKFYEIDKFAGLLQIPYILWCLFAAYLNYSVYLLNS